MVNVAVVGCGYWGPNLARNFANTADCRLVACCDSDTARLDTIRSSHPQVRTLTAFEDVLGDPGIDAVAIATPARSHHRMALAALRAGKHILVEKPLAMTSGEVTELMRVARENELVVMVGHTFLFSPSVRKARELLKSGYMGDFYQCDIQRLNFGRVQSDVSVLWSLGPHDVSIALFLLEGMPTWISATGGCHLTDGIDDTVDMTLMFPGGRPFNVSLSWLHPTKVRQFALTGSDRMMIVDDTNQATPITVFDRRARWSLHRNGHGERAVLDMHSGPEETPAVETSEPLAEECHHFVQSILHGREPLTGGRHALDVVKVLEAAQESIALNGRPVTLGASHQLAQVASALAD